MSGGRAHREVGNDSVRAGLSARYLLASRRWIPALIAVCVLGAIAALLALSLSSGSSKPRAAASGRSLRVAKSSLGAILVDDRGRTLYLFTHDGPSRSSCAGTCAGVWPPDTVSGKPTVAAGVSRRKASTLKRSDGGRQLVYNGHPLYRFSEDTREGQTGGQAFLGAWFVVSPAGEQIGKATARSAGGGY